MRRPWIVTVWLLSLMAQLCVSSQVRAQAGSFTRAVWQVQDGLPENIVQSIAQDADHYLWVATTGGLTRFDGSHFLPYRGTVRGAGLPVNSIFSVTAARDGSIWAGTEGGGLLHIKDGHSELLGAREGLTDSFVRSIIIDRTGLVWIGTDGGLYVYEGDHVRRVDGAKSPGGESVHSISEDREGRIWVGGEYLYSLKAGVREDYKLPGRYSENRVKAVLETADGTHWVGTVGGLVREMNGAFVALPEIRSTVRVLYQSSDGVLWIGTIGEGLWTYQKGRFERVDSQGLLPSNTVLSIFEDRSQNLWIGTQDGLVRLEHTPVRMVRLPVDRDADFGTIAMDGAKASWMVANSLYRITDGVARPFSFPQLRDVPLRNVMRGRDGSLWIGTDGGGAYHLGGAGQVTHYSSPRELTNNFIRGFLETARGEIWIATDEGLSRIGAGGVHQYGIAQGLAHFSTRCVVEDRRHDVWIGTDQGLSHFQAEHFVSDQATQALAQEKVWSIVEDHGGALWFGTRDHGIFRYREGQIQHFTTANGLITNSVYQLLEDRRQRLWISGPDTISSVDLAQLGLAEMGHTAPATEGMLSVRLYKMPFETANAELYGGRQPAGYVADDDSVWFATSRGAAHIVSDPASTEEPTLRIENVVADARELPMVKDLQLSPEVSRFTLYFTPLLLSSQDGLRFRYKMENFDTAWTNAGALRSATYTNLPAGAYRFRAQVVDIAFPDRITEVDFRFRKEPHLYQRGWFLGVLLLLLLMVVWGIYQLRVRQLRARFDAVLAERNRLAREMHDTVIQGCTSTSALLEALAGLPVDGPGGFSADGRSPHGELLSYARSQIRKTIDEARDAVWNLRHDRKVLVDLSKDLHAVAHQAARAFSIPVECRVSEGEVSVDASTAHEVLMIVREVLANAGLHAHAQHVLLEASSSRGGLQIDIRDDGAGFVVQQAAGADAGHFGLMGVRERTKRLGGTIVIESEVADGTHVRLQLPQRPERSALKERMA